MINEKKNVFIIGRLAKESIYERDRRISPILVNKRGDLQFTIEPLTDIVGFPELEEEYRYVSGYAQDLSYWGFDDSDIYDEEAKKKYLEQFLDNQILIFKPQLRQTGDGQYLVAKDIYMRIENNSNENTDYVPIPVFKNSEIYATTIENFEERLIKGKIVGDAPNMSKMVQEFPYGVIWQELEEEKYLYFEIKGHTHSYSSVKYEVDCEKLKKYKLDEEWDKQQYTSEDGSIVFIPRSFFQETQINKLTEVPIFLDDLVIDKNKQKNLETKKEGNIAYADIKTENSSLSLKENGENIIDFINNETDEGRLLHKFREACYKENLYYDDKDLINFHVSLKTGSLVVLSGQSGTGKSKLVRCYSRALQLKKGKVNFIPVRPFWQDDSDLLGYADTINSIYRPGDSGLVDTLIDAYENQDEIYMICFDEMNLAKVEHYFSQFLSVLEMDSDYRELKLYDESLEARFYNSDRYRPSVKIGHNVFFVGTVNIDESTHRFSDKVLDRANVITLKVLPFTEYRDKQLTLFKEYSNEPTEGISARTYKSFRNDNADLKLYELEIEFLWKIHEELSNINSNLGVGWRILRQIDKYIKNIPTNSVFNRSEAFDIQIVQRVLTKIRGSEEQFKYFVGSYKEGKVSDSLLLNLMIEYSEISNFEFSRKVISQKARDLSQDGYTL